METDGLSTAVGSKTWVRRRRWARELHRPAPGCVRSGWLEKGQGKLQRQRRWFVLTNSNGAQCLSYYKLEQEGDDSPTDLGGSRYNRPCAHQIGRSFSVMHGLKSNAWRRSEADLAAGSREWRRDLTLRGPHCPAVQWRRPHDDRDKRRQAVRARQRRRGCVTI